MTTKLGYQSSPGLDWHAPDHIPGSQTFGLEIELIFLVLQVLRPLTCNETAPLIFHRACRWQITGLLSFHNFTSQLLTPYNKYTYKYI
jgi:hypothetical protein